MHFIERCCTCHTIGYEHMLAPYICYLKVNFLLKQQKQIREHLIFFHGVYAFICTQFQYSKLLSE